MTWHHEQTSLRDLGWHEVPPKHGGYRRFERDDGHKFGYVEFSANVSEIAIAYSLGRGDGTLEMTDAQTEHERRLTQDAEDFHAKHPVPERTANRRRLFRGFRSAS